MFSENFVNTDGCFVEVRQVFTSVLLDFVNLHCLSILFDVVLVLKSYMKWLTILDLLALCVILLSLIHI